MTKTIRAFDRGLAVLRHLDRDGAVTLSDLAHATALPKATLLRLLATLLDNGWIYRRINDGRYVLAVSIGGRASAAVGRVRYARAVAPVLRRLTAATGLPADLTVVREPGSLEVIESTRRPADGAVDPQAVGFRPSLVFSSPGRAILSACGPALRDRHLDLILRSDSPAERFYVSSNALAQELRDTARRGYAVRAEGYWPGSVDFGEEPMDIAVPFHLGQSPRASISLVWPAGTRDPAEVARRHQNDLERAAERASRIYDDQLSARERGSEETTSP